MAEITIQHLEGSDGLFYRIQRYFVEGITAEDLFGDTVTELGMEECYRRMNMYGVYGFALEVWNPEVDMGWVQVDSCWGFLGEVDVETNKPHYIIEEFIKQTQGE